MSARSFLLLGLAPLVLIGAALAPARAEPAPDYLRLVTFERPGHQRVLLRWPHHEMPLRVHLPAPPDGLFPDPEAILDSVRGGITDWTDVAAPGVPSFVFVDDPGRAHIRIRWAARPTGDWYVAHCAYQIDAMTRRFRVEHVLVTGRWQDGRLADVHDVYGVMLHEVGHALGLGGHSDDPGDVMTAKAPSWATVSLSERDRATLKALVVLPKLRLARRGRRRRRIPRVPAQTASRSRWMRGWSSPRVGVSRQ